MPDIRDAMLGKPYQPRSARARSLAATPREFAMEQFGLDPTLDRATLWPWATGQDGLEFAIPEMGVEFLTAVGMPDYALRGGNITPEDAFNSALSISGGGLAASAATRSVPRGALGANVWQGGPHKYGPEGAAKSLDHISKGEGAQAYGWGRYDAENKAVAQEYERALGVQNKLIAVYGHPDFPSHHVVMRGEEVLSKHKTAEAANRALSKFPAVSSNLYKHDLPDEDIARYLDWDAPLSEQPEAMQAVQKAWMSRYGDDQDANLLRELLGDSGESLSMNDMDMFNEGKGAAAYKALTGRFGSDQAASEALAKAGIPGLKYYDGMSRGARGKWDIQSPAENTTGKWRVKQFGGANAQTFDTESAARDFLAQNAPTRNFVTWDQDVLNRMKLLERNGETF